jgi:hypothetical protein
VYDSNFTQDDRFYDAHNGYTYGADTDVTDVLAHTTIMQFEGKLLVNCNDKSHFLPREERLKLSPEKGEAIISTRRNERNTRFSGKPRPNAPVRRANIHDTQK